MYQIKDWEIDFETAKTKTFNRCQRLTFSNDLNDPHFRRLVRDHKDGYAHFGIWVAICEFHSSQSKPRLGYLTDDGQPDGTPLSTSEIADLIRAPEKMVETALERLSNPYIGWITDERRPHDDQAETVVADQSSLLISPLQTTPLKGVVQTQILEWFNLFWTKEIWGDLRGKTKAEEAWLKIDNLDEQLFGDICRGAVAYKAVRFDILKNGGTPKMAQGWLNDRRWEDEAPEGVKEESTLAHTPTCKVCGEPATKTIEGHGSYCTKHSPYDSGEPGGV